MAKIKYTPGRIDFNDVPLQTENVVQQVEDPTVTRNQLPSKGEVKDIQYTGKRIFGSASLTGATLEEAEDGVQQSMADEATRESYFRIDILMKDIRAQIAERKSIAEKEVKPELPTATGEEIERATFGQERMVAVRPDWTLDKELSFQMRGIKNSALTDDEKIIAYQRTSDEYLVGRIEQVQQFMQEQVDWRVGVEDAIKQQGKIGGKLERRVERGMSLMASGAFFLIDRLQRMGLQRVGFRDDVHRVVPTPAETARMYHQVMQEPEMQPIIDNAFDKYIGGVVESGPYLATGLATAVLTHGATVPTFVGAFLTAYAVEANSSYQASLDRGEPEYIARMRADIVGLIGAGIETVGGAGASKYWKGRIIKNATSKLSKARRYSTRLVKDALREGILEEIPQEINMVVLGGDVPRTVEGNIDADAIVGRLWDAGAIGTIAGLGASASIQAVQSAQRFEVEVRKDKKEAPLTIEQAKEQGLQDYITKFEDAIKSGSILKVQEAARDIAALPDIRSEEDVAQFQREVEEATEATKIELGRMPWRELQAEARKQGVNPMQKRDVLEAELSKVITKEDIPLAKRLTRMPWRELQAEARQRGIAAFQTREQLTQEILIKDGVEEIPLEERLGQFGWVELQDFARSVGVNAFQKRGKVIADILSKEKGELPIEKAKVVREGEAVVFDAASNEEEWAVEAMDLMLGETMTAGWDYFLDYADSIGKDMETMDAEDAHAALLTMLEALPKEIQAAEGEEQAKLEKLLKEGQRYKKLWDTMQEEGEAVPPATEEQLQFEEALAKFEISEEEMDEDMLEAAEEEIEGMEAAEELLGLTSPLTRMSMFFDLHINRAIRLMKHIYPDVELESYDHALYLKVFEGVAHKFLTDNRNNPEVLQEFLDGTERGFDKSMSFEEELANEEDIAMVRRLRERAQDYLRGEGPLDIVEPKPPSDLSDEDLMFQAISKRRELKTLKEIAAENPDAQEDVDVAQEELLSLTNELANRGIKMDLIELEPPTPVLGEEGKGFRELRSEAILSHRIRMDDFVEKELLKRRLRFTGDKETDIETFIEDDAERLGIAEEYAQLKKKHGSILQWKMHEVFPPRTEAERSVLLEDWMEEHGDRFAMDEYMKLGLLGIKELEDIQVGDLFTEDPHVFAEVMRKTREIVEGVRDKIVDAEGKAKLGETARNIGSFLAVYDEIMDIDIDEEGRRPGVAEPKPPTKPTPEVTPELLSWADEARAYLIEEDFEADEGATPADLVAVLGDYRRILSEVVTEYGEEKAKRELDQLSKLIRRGELLTGARDIDPTRQIAEGIDAVPPTPKTPAELLLDAGYWQDRVAQLRSELAAFEELETLTPVEEEELRATLADALREYYDAEEALGEPMLGEDKTVEGLLEDVVGEEALNMRGPVGQLITEVPDITKEQQETLYTALAQGIIPGTFPSYNDMMKELIQLPDAKKLEGEEATKALKGKRKKFADTADVRGIYLKRIMLPQAEEGLGEVGKAPPEPTPPKKPFIQDASGNPKIFYHGTPHAAFGEFDIPVFFTRDAEAASAYTELDRGREGKAAGVVVARLTISNPFDTGTREGALAFFELAKRAGIAVEAEEVSENLWDLGLTPDLRATPTSGESMFDLLYLPAMIDQLLKEGYDGVVGEDPYAGGTIPIIVAIDAADVHKGYGKRRGPRPGQRDAGFLGIPSFRRKKPTPPVSEEPPPPPGIGPYRVPSQEELNQSNDELLAKLSQVKKVRKDEEIPAIKRMRTKQIARALGIQEAVAATGVPAAEVIRRSKGGYKVVADTPQYTPIELTDAQWDAYSRQVYSVYTGAEYKFQQTAAQDALDALRDGRIITDAQAALLIPVMGIEVAEQIATTMEKLGDKYQRFWNLARDIVLFWKMPFNFDIQFTRNAVNFLGRHPVKYTKGTYEALRSFASKDYTNILIQATRGDPAYAEAEAYGIPFLQMGQLAPLGKVPEQFRGRLPYRLAKIGKKRGKLFRKATTGIRLIGKWQLAAERSFVASANWFMLDLWKTRSKRWNASLALLEETGLSVDERERIKEQVDKHKKNYADVVGNYMKIIQAKSSTGRAIQTAANYVLWSPSMTWSRFRRPEMMLLKTGSRAYAMSIEATSVAKIYAIGILLTTVANYYRDDDDQVEVELDPTSSNWGRFKEGDTWYDFGGGEIQHYRTMAQFVVGTIKTQSGRAVEIPRAEIAKGYVEGRETALIGIFHELLTGESIFGQKVWAAPDLEQLQREGTVTAEIYAEAWRRSSNIPGGQTAFLTGRWLTEHLMPAALVSFAEASITDGWPQAVAAGLTEAMAMGAQSYKRRASAELAIMQDELAQAYHQKKWDALTSKEQNDIRDNEPPLYDVQISMRKEQKQWAKPTFERREEQEIENQLFDALSDAVKNELETFGLTAGTLGRRFGPTDAPFYLNEERHEKYVTLAEDSIQTMLDQLIGSTRYKGREKREQEMDIKAAISEAKLAARDELLRMIDEGKI